MRKLLCLLITFCLLWLCSCEVQEADDEFADDLGREVYLCADDRVAACHASFADCWILSGGELVGVTSDAVDEHRLEVGNAKIIGTAKSLDLEALISSGATAVLLSADLAAHLEIEGTLKRIGITCIYLRVDNFQDYSRVMELFCRINGGEELYRKQVTEVGERIEKILSSIPPNEERSVLLMRAYSSGIKAKRDDNLAGQILGEFGLFNIADEYPSMLEDMSLEHIVATDPDAIFVLTMGNEAAARAYLEANIESNPAFSGLTAVKNGNYYMLPKELFHYKPNERWDESYEYLARILYPSVFAED